MTVNQYEHYQHTETESGFRSHACAQNVFREERPMFPLIISLLNYTQEIKKYWL